MVNGWRRRSTMGKTIYVVSGTNGVGKSTIREQLLPPDIPYINADFILQNLKAGQSNLALAELAKQYGSEQIKKCIAANESFSFENNLHQEQTFKWLEGMQKRDYQIQIYYVGVVDLNMTTDRIAERVKRGEHHVPKDEVFARYENGIRLMRHYFAMPEKIVFVDNTKKRLTCLEVEKGKIVFQNKNSPQWVKDFVASLTIAIPSPAKNLNSIDEVRKEYETLKKRY